MKYSPKITIILLLLLMSLTCFSETKNKEVKKYCVGVDNEKMPLGSKWVFTCNTDPKTKENILYRYCLLDQDGNAKWSKDYAEYDPKGC